MPSTTAQSQSISGIITQVHSTTGEVPPPLVGASITVVENHVYVFAGRLVTSRKMTNHLYVLDLDTLVWTRHIPPPDSAKPPKPRYFHSADVYNKSIVIFGGMGYSRISTDGLCVLDDISVFDIESMCWKRLTVEPSLFAPRPRYAHLSAVTDDKLIIIGGQDMNNNYLGEINVLDLRKCEWVHAKTFDKHVGAYRSIAVSGPPDTRLPTMLNGGSTPDTNGHLPPSSAAGGSSDYSASNNGNNNTKKDTPPVYLYTNYNFADVKRELQLIFSPTGASSIVEDCSSYMTGSALPPGLRFPTGHTLGHHLVLAGTYLSPQTQAFSIWALDLGTLAWTRVEAGSLFSNGSWNRGVLHRPTNRYLVFGHKARNLLEDYNNRQINFDHIAAVDMEAFGVYEVPKASCSTLAQEMGLSLLNEPAISDFSIQTLDNQVIPVNSAVLRKRWPYFAKLMESNVKSVQVLKTVEKPGTNESSEETVTIKVPKSNTMSFPYPYSVTIALLQYLYTDNLLTAQQYQPHILSQLLLLSDMYELDRLRALATHALHQMLNMTTAPLIFETAALSHQTSLQVRALKMMIAAKRLYQQQQQQQEMSPQDGTYSVYGESVSSIDGRRPSDFPTPTSTTGYYQSSSPVPSTPSYHHRGYAGQPSSPPIRRNNTLSQAIMRGSYSAHSTYSPKAVTATTDISPPPTPRHGVPLGSASVPTSPELNSSRPPSAKKSSKDKRPILQSVGGGIPMNFPHF